MQQQQQRSRNAAVPADVRALLETCRKLYYRLFVFLCFILEHHRPSAAFCLGEHRVRAASSVTSPVISVELASEATQVALLPNASNCAQPRTSKDVLT